MIEKIYSSEVLVDFQWTAWNYIPKERNINNHSYENIKSYMKEQSNKEL
jgi:hypothetical protein